MSAAAEQIDDYVPSWDTEEARRSWRRRTSLEMIISGFIGLVTSFVLSIEAWQLAADSSARFGCDVSSVLSCSAVAQTWQARILGFPNAFLGIFFEAVVLAISVAIFAGVTFPRWYMACTNLLYTIALFFAFWLFGQSYFIIQVLCPLVLAYHADDHAGLWRHHADQHPRRRDPGSGLAAPDRRSGVGLGAVGPHCVRRPRDGRRQVRSEASGLSAGRTWARAVFD